MEKQTVLVVDDNPDYRWMIAEVLEADFKVVEVSSGEAALDYLGTNPRPAVILSDGRMPKMSGFDLRRKILEIPELARIPFCIFSGAREHTEALELKLDAHVDKPATAKEIIELVRSLCS